jgi:hypothetical protein
MAGFDAGETEVLQPDLQERHGQASPSGLAWAIAREGGTSDKPLHFCDVWTYLGFSGDDLVPGDTECSADWTVHRFRVDGCRPHVHELGNWL